MWEAIGYSITKNITNIFILLQINSLLVLMLHFFLSILFFSKDGETLGKDFSCPSVSIPIPQTFDSS